MKENILRQLTTVIRSFTQGNNFDYEIFDELLQNIEREENKDPVDIFEEIWQNPALIEVVPSDLLKIGLNIPSIAKKCVLKCLHLIHEQNITGKQALYCISEIQNYLDDRSMNINDSKAAGSLLEDLHAISQQCLQSINSTRDQTFSQLSLSQLSFSQPLISQSLTQSNQQSSSQPQSVSILSLELIPIIVQLIHRLFHSKSTLKFIQQLKNSSSLNTSTILESFFVPKWTSKSVVFLSNLAAEMWHNLETRHKSKLKKKIIEVFCIAYNDKDLSIFEDLPGIIRVCAHIVDISGDISWIHVIRLLYHHTSQPSVKISSILTIESLLQQIFSQFPQHQLVYLIESMETLAIQQYSTIINDSYKSREDMETYTEYDGIPQFTSSDLNLLLLFYRSMVLGLHTTSTNITANFPRSTFNTNIEEITAARAYFVILLCSYFIQLSDSLIVESDNSPNISKLVELKNISKLLSLFHGNIATSTTATSTTATSSTTSLSNTSSTSTSWLIPCRANDLIQFIFLLTTNLRAITIPATQTLLNMFLQSKLQTRHRNTLNQLLNHQTLTRDILCHSLYFIFEHFHDHRRSIITTTLSNLMSHASKIQSSSSSSLKRIDVDISGYLIHFIQFLCSSHLSNQLLPQSSSFQTYLSSFSLLPIAEFKRYIISILPLTSSDESLFASILTVCRKSLHHLDISRRELSIEILVELFFYVNPQKQNPIIDLFQYLLTYPLRYRTLFYRKFLYFFLRFLETNSQSSSPTSGKTLSSNGLKLLLVDLCKQFDQFLSISSSSVESNYFNLRELSTTGDRNTDKKNKKEKKTESKKRSRSLNKYQINRWNEQKHFNPIKCFELSSTNSNKSDIHVKDDIFTLFQTIFVIESYLSSSSQSSSSSSLAFEMNNNQQQQQQQRTISSTILSWSRLKDSDEIEEELLRLTEDVSTISTSDLHMPSSGYCLSILLSAHKGFQIDNFQQNDEENEENLLTSYFEEKNTETKNIYLKNIQLQYVMYYRILLSLKNCLKIFDKFFVSKSTNSSSSVIQPMIVVESVIETLFQVSGQFFEERSHNELISKFNSIYLEKIESDNLFDLYEEIDELLSFNSEQLFNRSERIYHLFQLSNQQPQSTLQSPQNHSLPFSVLVGLLAFFCHDLHRHSISRHSDNSFTKKIFSNLMRLYRLIGQIEHQESVLDNYLQQLLNTPEIKKMISNKNQTGNKKRRSDSNSNRQVDEEESLNQEESKTTSFDETNSFDYLNHIYKHLPVQLLSSMKSIDCQILSDTLQNNSNFSNLSMKKLEEELFGNLHRFLFTFRCELLLGLTSILNSETNADSHPSKNAMTSVFNSEKMNFENIFVFVDQPTELKEEQKHLLVYLCSEFHCSVQSGLTERNFRTFLHSIQAAVSSQFQFSLPNEFKETKIQNWKQTVLHSLLDSLSHLEGSPVSFIRNIIQLYLYLKPYLVESNQSSLEQFGSYVLFQSLFQSFLSKQHLSKNSFSTSSSQSKEQTKLTSYSEQYRDPFLFELIDYTHISFTHLIKSSNDPNNNNNDNDWKLLTTILFSFFQTSTEVNSFNQQATNSLKPNDTSFFFHLSSEKLQRKILGMVSRYLKLSCEKCRQEQRRIQMILKDSKKRFLLPSNNNHNINRSSLQKNSTKSKSKNRKQKKTPSKSWVEKDGRDSDYSDDESESDGSNSDRSDSESNYDDEQEEGGESTEEEDRDNERLEDDEQEEENDNEDNEENEEEEYEQLEMNREENSEEGKSTSNGKMSGANGSFEEKLIQFFKSSHCPPLLFEILSFSSTYSSPSHSSPRSCVLLNILTHQSPLFVSTTIGKETRNKIEELFLCLMSYFELFVLIRDRYSSHDKMNSTLFQSNYFQKWNQCFEIFQTSKGILNKLKRNSQENSDQEDNSEDIEKQIQLNAKHKRTKKRARSTNKVIDEWLEDENGQDAFADLEDFLV